MNDQEWEELFDKYITEVVDDEQEHIKSHELPTAIKIRGLVSDSASQAAANKAAEEGGLPKMNALIDAAEERAKLYDGDDRECIKADVMNAFFAGAEYADRASRQVANKAEVEPVAFMTSDKKMLVFADAMRKLQFDPAGMVALYDTPPATTGASTARDQALEEAALICEGVNNYTNPMTANDCADSIRALKGSIGASTVLTDERKPFAYVKFRAAQNISSEGDVDANEWYEFCEQEDVGDDKLPAFPVYDQPVREVAAQAGQVAVPGWVNVDDRLPEFRHECTSSGCEVSDSLMVYGQNEFGTTGCGFGHARDDGTWSTYQAEYYQLTVVKVTHWMPLPAAPSPAKESK